MTYHSLASETGGDDFARNREAHKIVIAMKLTKYLHDMESREKTFVMDSYSRLQQFGVDAIFSTKQIFWLRDLKEKYIR